MDHDRDGQLTVAELTAALEGLGLLEAGDVPRGQLSTTVSNNKTKQVKQLRSTLPNTKSTQEVPKHLEECQSTLKSTRNR